MNIEEETKIKSLKEDFFKICDSKFNQEKYYELIVGVGFEDYDHYYTYTTELDINVPGTQYISKKDIFGRKKIVSVPGLVNQRVGIYAMKDKTGIYEMVTGRRVAVFGAEGSMYCYGLRETNNLKKIGNDLKLLESNFNFKNQYIEKLTSISDGVYGVSNDLYQKELKEIQEKNAMAQYVKSYRIPRK